MSHQTTQYIAKLSESTILDKNAIARLIFPESASPRSIMGKRLERGTLFSPVELSKIRKEMQEINDLSSKILDYLDKLEEANIIK